MALLHEHRRGPSARATTPFTWLENAFLAEVEIAHRAWATAAHNRWLTTLHHLLSPSAATRANHRPSESSRKGRTLLRAKSRSEEHTSELQSHSDLVCR